ncbi:hypothetical protein DDZ18_03200 [Marinicauda salina]|uniref:MAPEG family protein n=1 Tax=Marinicauda salina TaxID=2135793 RepID=A0A2U2BX71_9PROT|nr:MAPEG family protein [Marinicauda salina]PWE18623.1 hypothetical protein DDZ18_03200 [Marinicauda salina]
MSIPVWVLLGFAAWTLASLMASIGVYRWSRILTGRASISEWRADLPQGDERYRRAMRAHQNCVENLPVYTALVVALTASGTGGPVVDGLAIAILAARVPHTVIHVALEQTEPVAAIRFGFFAVQVACMIGIGAIIVADALG